MVPTTVVVDETFATECVMVGAPRALTREGNLLRNRCSAGLAGADSDGCRRMARLRGNSPSAIDGQASLSGPGQKPAQPEGDPTTLIPPTLASQCAILVFSAGRAEDSVPCRRNSGRVARLMAEL